MLMRHTLGLLAAGVAIVLAVVPGERGARLRGGQLVLQRYERFH